MAWRLRLYSLVLALIRVLVLPWELLAGGLLTHLWWALLTTTIRTTLSALATGAPATTLATTPAARVSRTAVAHPLQHLCAGVFGRCGHHVAARRFAQTTPNRLATHGYWFGALVVFWEEFRHVHARDFLFGETFNIGQKAFFVQAHQAHRLAFFASAAGAANAVHIVFTHIRNFIVHHMRQIVNINTACCNISSYQCPDFARFEAGQRLRARALALVAMQCHGANAVLF